MSKVYNIINDSDNVEAYVVKLEHSQPFHVYLKDLLCGDIIPVISKFHSLEDAVKHADKLAHKHENNER